jgi:hypothetical protein
MYSGDFHYDSYRFNTRVSPFCLARYYSKIHSAGFRGQTHGRMNNQTTGISCRGIVRYV